VRTSHADAREGTLAARLERAKSHLVYLLAVKYVSRVLENAGEAFADPDGARRERGEPEGG
jgi:hypothetical protein